MELRCLLGHEFGEREVERERREAGDEVVVVYRTVENCGRCGTRRVVSENKEVRSIDAVAEGEPPATVEAAAGEAGADAEAGTESDGAPAVDAGGESVVGSGTDGGADDGEAPARPGSLIEAAEAVGAAETGESGATDDREEGDATDDAVIIGGNGTAGPAGDGDGDGDGDADDRGTDPSPGTDAAGEAADTDPADGTAVGTDEDVTAPEGGVELLGGGGDAGNGTGETDAAGTAAGADAAGTAAGADAAGTAAGTDAAGTAAGTDAAGTAAGTDAADGTAGGAAAGWPEQSPGAGDEGYDATPHEDTATGVDFGGGFAPTAAGDGAAGDGVEPAFVGAGDRSVAARDADGPTELCCANCGATRAAAGSSLRGGDICPECRKGYVAERAIEE